MSVNNIKYEGNESLFDGKVIEFIIYKIWAFFLNIITLTIASSWTECVLLSYQFNHTVYDGKRLKFEGKGVDLFVKRIKWIVLSIITFGVYIFWISINKQKWIVSNLHFEDEEFVKEESFFDGNLFEIILINIVTLFINIITVGFLYPFSLCLKQRWLAKHTFINKKEIEFIGKTKNLIVFYLVWWLLTIVTIGVFGIWMPIKSYNWQVKNTHLK